MASKEEKNNDIKKIVEWAKTMKEKGIFHSSTARNRIRAIQDISSILGEDEAKDPESLLNGIADIAGRWARKTSATPTDLITKKSHARNLLSDYIEYQEDPGGFKPQARGKRIKKEKVKPRITAPEKKRIKKKTKAENEETTELQRPLLNINIQIHISAETSEKQIDKIFESMSKYIPFKKT